MRYRDNYYPPYVSVGEKKARAKKKLDQLIKNKSDIKPVIIEGRTLASTWWGKSWNLNLERYADYSNRIGRGRSYVRSGAVLDLKLLPGKVTSLVQGSVSKPYEITIKINSINNKIWNNIKEDCLGKLESLGELLEGKFPKALGEVFLAKGEGLFPSPKEINLSCSCPDSAYMCKHIAASLYGIGARLDENPMLFFKLRNVEVNDLVTQAVQSKTKKMLEKANQKSKRAIKDTDISKIFGIELDEMKTETQKVKSTKKNENRNKLSISKEKKPAKSDGITLIDMIYEIILQKPKGINIAALVKKTAFEEKKIYNVIYRLKKQNRIVEIYKKFYLKNEKDIVNKPAPKSAGHLTTAFKKAKQVRQPVDKSNY